MNIELDITDFFRNAGMIDYSASASEIGQDARQVTWKAACDDSAQYPLLRTEDEKEAFRLHIKRTGGWPEDEIAKWNDTELNALCMQCVAGDVRQAELTPESDQEDWDNYYTAASEGNIPSTLTRGDDGKIYYTLGE